jgi:hypothetical protein
MVLHFKAVGVAFGAVYHDNLRRGQDPFWKKTKHFGALGQIYHDNLRREQDPFWKKTKHFGALGRFITTI